MAEEQGNSVDKLVYFLIGAGIGAITALLFAPKAGKELRAEIADATRRSVDYARDTGRELGDRAGDYYQTGVERASDLAARSKETVTGFAERGKEVVARQKAQVSAAIEAGKAGYREAKQQDQGKAGAAVEES
jgi:gas vesicle protein